ncbi:MAG: low molecular weight phosphotyrosine protein phosphatase [Paramuribaculum sp.]|nr:low molecular weight phosphotyrosine protein phosphatase [Paramuribaculum sp.]
MIKDDAYLPELPAAGCPVKVLFVCLGNICRSPAAEGIMRETVERAGVSDGWVIDSAGTGNYHVGQLPDSRMRAHARRRGLNLTHRCRQVTLSDFDDFDIIVAMDGSNEMNLRRLAPSHEAEAKIVRMADFFDMTTRYDHVPDPYYEGAEGFELVLDLLTDATLNLMDTVAARRR